MKKNYTATLVAGLVCGLSEVAAAQNTPLPDLVTDFRQAGAHIDQAFKACSLDTLPGNCATIALIKAALAEFGTINVIFTTFQRDADSTRCIFRDGTRVAVGSGELATVRDSSGIAAARVSGMSTFQQDAITMYALICKRMWVLRNDFTDHNGSKGKCVKSYLNAVSLLNSGYPTRDAFRLLALDTVRITSFGRLATIRAAIIYSSSHAAFCSNNRQDRFGTVFTVYQVFETRKPTGRWMMGLARKRGSTIIPVSRILGAYRLALPRS
jgi:hypothetical protein